jgi:hypothetical protein
VPLEDLALNEVLRPINLLRCSRGLIVSSLVVGLGTPSEVRLSKYRGKEEALRSISSLRYVLRLNILMPSASVGDNTRVGISGGAEESTFNVSCGGGIDDSRSDIFLSISESIESIIASR